MAGNPEQFNGRHVTGPDTDVLGSVFFGSGAIVVDFEENPEPYERGYAMLGRLLERSQEPTPMEIGRATNSIVDKLVPYSEKNVGQVLRAEAVNRGILWIEREDEVNLSLFMGGGICHHQTLFGSVLIRLLQERQGIGGEITVEMAPLMYVGEPERHIWSRYARDGQRVDIDYSEAPHVVLLDEHEHEKIAG